MATLPKQESFSARYLTKEVFPLPPTERFPTEITGTSNLKLLKTPRS